jgi:hypothetical protein
VEGTKTVPAGESYRLSATVLPPHRYFKILREMYQVCQTPKIFMQKLNNNIIF